MAKVGNQECPINVPPLEAEKSHNCFIFSTISNNRMADMWTCEVLATLMPSNLGSWNNVSVQPFEKNNAISVMVLFCRI